MLQRVSAPLLCLSLTCILVLSAHVDSEYKTRNCTRPRAYSPLRTTTMNREVNGEGKTNCEGGEASDLLLAGAPSPKGVVDLLMPQCTNDRDVHGIARELVRIISRIVDNLEKPRRQHGGVSIRPVNAMEDGLVWRFEAPRFILSRTSRESLDNLIALGTYYALGTYVGEGALVFAISEYPEETAERVHN